MDLPQALIDLILRERAAVAGLKRAMDARVLAQVPHTALRAAAGVEERGVNAACA